MDEGRAQRGRIGEPIPERFEVADKRPRKEMKTEIDQAHFLIGAAMPGSGVNWRKSSTKTLGWSGEVSRSCSSGTPRWPPNHRLETHPTLLGRFFVRPWTDCVSNLRNLIDSCPCLMIGTSCNSLRLPFQRA